VALLSLSACGGDPLKDNAAAPPPPVATSLPSATPSAPAPALGALIAPPTVATQRTDAGAVAFVSYYFETLLNNAYQSGNVSLIALVSDPNCVVCRATIGDVAYFAATGTHAAGGRVSVALVKVAHSAPELTTITMSYSVEKLTELNRDGSTAYDTAALTNQDIVVQVQWDAAANAWRMRQIIDKPLSAITAAPSTRYER
jgi:hypothetical protein